MIDYVSTITPIREITDEVNSCYKYIMYLYILIYINVYARMYIHPSLYIYTYIYMMYNIYVYIYIHILSLLGVIDTYWVR